MRLSDQELQRIVNVLQAAGFEVEELIEADDKKPEATLAERWDEMLRRLSAPQWRGAR